MKTVNKLQKEAATACSWRMHKMGPWMVTINTVNRSCGGAICLKCNMGVQYDTKPPPNGIEIGGEAVALDCLVR